MSIKQIIAQHQSFGNLISVYVKTRKDKPSEPKFVTVHSVNDDFFIGKCEKDERPSDVIYYSDITKMRLDYNFHSLVGKNVKLYRLLDINNKPTPSVVMGRVDYIRSEIKDDGKIFDYLLFSGGNKVLVHEIIKMPEIIESVPKPVEPKVDSGNLWSGKSFELTTGLNEKVTLTFDKKIDNQVFLKMFENDYIKFQNGYNKKEEKVNLDEYIDKIVKISYVKKDGNVNKLPFYFTGLLELRNGNKVYMSNTYVCEKEDVCLVEHPIDSSQSFNLEKLKKITQNSDVIIWIQNPQSEKGIPLRAVFDRLVKLNTKFGVYYISVLLEKSTLQIKENTTQDIEITLFSGKKIKCWYCGTYEVGNRRYISVLINANGVLDTTIEGIRPEFEKFFIRQDTLFIDEPIDAFENEDGIVDNPPKIDFMELDKKYVYVQKFNGEKLEGYLNNETTNILLTKSGYDWEIVSKIDIQNIEKSEIHEEIQKHIKNKSPIIFKYYDMLTYIVFPKGIILDGNCENYIMMGKKQDEKFELQKMCLIKDQFFKYSQQYVILEYLESFTSHDIEKTSVIGLLSFKNGIVNINGHPICGLSSIISCNVLDEKELRQKSIDTLFKYNYLFNKYVHVKKVDGSMIKGYLDVEDGAFVIKQDGHIISKNIKPLDVKSIEEKKEFKYEHLVGQYVEVIKISGEKMEGYLSIESDYYCLTLGEFKVKVNLYEVSSIVKKQKENVIYSVHFPTKEGYLQMATDIHKLVLSKYFIPAQYMEKLGEIVNKKEDPNMIKDLYDKIRDNIIQNVFKTKKLNNVKMSSVFVSQFMEIFLTFSKKYMPANVVEAEGVLKKLQNYLPPQLNEYALKMWKELEVNRRYQIWYRCKEKEVTFVNFFTKQDKDGHKEYVVVIDHSEQDKNKTLFTQFITFKQ